MLRTVKTDGETNHIIYMKDGSIIKGVKIYRKDWGAVLFTDLFDEQDFYLWEPHIKKIVEQTSIYKIELTYNTGVDGIEYYEEVRVVAQSKAQAEERAELSIGVRFPNYSKIEFHDTEEI